MKIVLALPQALTSLFVVTTEREPFDVSSVPWRVGAPHRKAAIRALGSPPLLVTHHPSRWKSGTADLTADERRLVRRSRQHIVVSTTAPPHDLPDSVQVARATARAIARECHGPLIDPLTGVTVPTCERSEGEPVDFDLDDDWLGWDVHTRDAAACPRWSPPAGSPAGTAPCWEAAGAGPCESLTVTSRGLQRFALPEITIEGAACAHSLCATGLLRAVARRLVTDHLAFVAAHPDARRRTIDDHLRIEPSLPYGGAPFGVRLTPCEPSPSKPGGAGGIGRLKVGPTGGAGQVTCLRVGPPSGFTGSLNDWLWGIQEASRAALTSSGAHIPEPSPVLAA